MTAATLSCVVATPAFGQATTAELMAADIGSLRDEIQQRYDLALARSTDPAVINANDSRYNWANEAKVQCGIALGFLKSSTRDETSISNCVLAAGLIDRVDTPLSTPAVPPMASGPAEICDQRQPGIVFFDFDSATPPADAQQTIQFVAQNAGPCGWTAIDVVGHTDRSGSDAYNDGLSRRRAEAVASLMTSMGVQQAAITTGARGESSPRVPTEDGVRNPQNRRVEIGVR
ncbi:OmpA family protein [Altererythrobacter aerius]|uniref:OmpA family protein n=1 Tax=Tsuneonella aeria TaxID=1837929 RepID=A0A6I4TB64_9SPHN|nr:OmpA family protein [Tsuneonella aeria]MXO73994.1 OmpA family protein [Tsuneonella aeria]